MSPARKSRPGERPSDAALLARVAAHDLDALGQLYDRYCADVRRVAGRLGVAEGELDDVVQATFLDVMRAAPSFDGRESARPWVFGIATMIVRRRRRSFARLAARLERLMRSPPPAPVASPDEELDRRRLGERIVRALDALSDRKREVVVLVMIEGASGEEAAEALGIPLNTVWTRLHHARKELRAHLEGDAP